MNQYGNKWFTILGIIILIISIIFYILLNNMFNFKNKTYLKILFFLSFITLTTAFAIQYLLGYQPCNLCIIERIPYMFSMIILILIFKSKKGTF